MRKHIETELYKKIVENVPIMSVDVVVFDKDLKNTLLFLRENPPAKGEFYTPGGRLYKGENFLECAIKNLKNESGIEVSENDLHYAGITNEYFTNSFFDKITPTHYVNVYFALRLDKKIKIKLDSQHSEYKWFGVEDKSFYTYVGEKVRNSLNILRENERN